MSMTLTTALTPEQLADVRETVAAYQAAIAVDWTAKELGTQYCEQKAAELAPVLLAELDRVHAELDRLMAASAVSA